MNLHDWIDELCDVLDIELEVDEALVLDLARDAAHNVERPAAPISTFLLGYAAAASEGDQAELERLAGLASDLALRWDRPAEEVADRTPEVDPDDSGGAGMDSTLPDSDDTDTDDTADDAVAGDGERARG